MCCQWAWSVSPRKHCEVWVTETCHRDLLECVRDTEAGCFVGSFPDSSVCCGLGIPALVTWQLLYSIRAVYKFPLPMGWRGFGMSSCSAGYLLAPAFEAFCSQRKRSATLWIVLISVNQECTWSPSIWKEGEGSLHSQVQLFPLVVAQGLRSVS